MKKRNFHVSPARRVIAILLMAVITPVLLFSVYEITTSGETEKMMQDAYVRQLDAILFSANQFASDAVSSWKKETEVQYLANSNSMMQQSTLFTPESALLGVAIADGTLEHITWFYKNKLLDKKIITGPSTDKDIPRDTITASVVSIYDNLLASKFGINRLIRFSKQNYYKTESLPVLGGKYIMFAFVVAHSGQQSKVGIIITERDRFMREVLLPRFRSIAGDRFTIGVFPSELTSDNEVIATKDSSGSNFTKMANLWVMPEWKIGIRLEGVDLAGINEERKLYLVLLIVLLNLLIAAAVIFVYRSIKKEMALALIKSEFVSNVSHELRTPLSLIGMFAETLESGRVRTEEKKQEYYRIIGQETKRLSRIVNKILNFSQIEAGVRKYTFEPHALNEVVEAVFASYQFHFQQKDFNASMQLHTEDLVLHMDKEAVVEAMINLLDNAMKYSAETKEIFVKTGVKGDMAFISVKDSGIGISAEDKQRVFEKFFRVSEGGTHNVKGTGLGLSIVTHIAEAHQGYIGLESSLGEGSTFTIYLALKRQTA